MNSGTTKLAIQYTKRSPAVVWSRTIASPEDEVPPKTREEVRRALGGRMLLLRF